MNRGELLFVEMLLKKEVSLTSCDLFFFKLSPEGYSFVKQVEHANISLETHTFDILFYLRGNR